MSLINDALKRAKRSQQQTPSGALPLPPVESRSPGGTDWALPTLAALFVAGACLFIGLAFAKRTLPAKNPGNPTIVATVAPQKIETSAAAHDLPKTSPAPASQTAAGSSTSSKLKVQGIFYDPSRPQAIVNGRTIGVGARVGDFRVKAISPDRVVFIAADGTEKILGLGE